MFQIVTDSTCDLPEGDLARLGVISVPLHVSLDGRLFRDGLDLEPEGLFHHMRQGGAVSTSPPGEATFARLWRQLPAGPVLALHLSQHLSETVSEARAAAQAVGREIEVMDSGAVSFSLAELVLTAVRLRDQGCPLAEALPELVRVRESLRLQFVVPDLRWLRQGGRLSRGAELLGNLLNVRPVLTMQGGRVVLDRRVNESQALNNVLGSLKQTFGDAPLSVSVAHAGRDTARIAGLQQAVRGSGLRVARGRLQLAGCVIGAHIGPGAYGILAVPA